MEDNLEVGTVLVAHKKCKMQDGFSQALIVGKEYPIKGFFGGMLVIHSETDDDHYFHMDEDDVNYYKNWFNVKK